MQTKVLEMMNRYQMVSQSDCIVVGLSGGADSVALVHILIGLDELLSLQLVAVHVNHGLRPVDADEDEQFVRSFCAEHRIPLEVFSVSVREEAQQMKVTEEEAGRILRYRAFEEIAVRYGAEKIAVAHHLNDSVETTLMRICRGTGLKGLGGIWPVRGQVIRPLIGITREEIEGYCADNGLLFRQDLSNFEKKYTRNKIRLEALPYLQKEIHSGVVDNIFRMSALVREEDAFLDDLAKMELDRCLISKEDVVLDLHLLRQQPEVLQRRIIRNGFARVRSDIQDVSFEHIAIVMRLLAKGSGMANLPNGLCVFVEYDRVRLFVLDEKTKETGTVGFCYPLKEDVPVFIPELQKNVLFSCNKKEFRQQVCTKIFSYDKMNLDLEIRSRRAGDSIYLETIGGHKKLKRFFSDKKIPRLQRDRIPLFACGNDIIWIMDEHNVVGSRYMLSSCSDKQVYLYLWEDF